MTTARTEELRFRTAEEAIADLTTRLRDAHRALESAFELIDLQKAQLSMQIAKISDVQYDEKGRIVAVVSRTLKEEGR